MRRALQFVQGRFGAVEQAGFQKVLRQGVLGPVAVFAAEVGARQQVFVHPHGTVVVAAAAEQVAQGKVQFGGVRVALDGFNEGVDGLVLLLVEQVVEATKISLGGFAALHAHLPHVPARSQPTQAKRQGQGPQQPSEIKVHGARVRGWVGRRGFGAGRPCVRGVPTTTAAASTAHPR